MFRVCAPSVCAGLALLAAVASGSAALAQDTAPPAPNSLDEEIAQQVRVGQEILPRRVDPITTGVSLHAEGRELVYGVHIDAPFASIRATQARFQVGNELGMCRSPVMARMVRRGVTIRHDYTDSEGATFATRVTSCPSVPTVVTPPHPGTTDPILSAELARLVEAERALFPYRIDSLAQAVGQRVEGIELILDVRLAVPFPLGRETFHQSVQSYNQRSVCARPASAALIRRGASMRADYTDATGDTVLARVTACP